MQWLHCAQTLLLKSYFSPHGSEARQGCCLSLFLFNLAEETLAIALGEEEKVIGVTRNEKTHKVLLYADDLLFYLSNPVESLCLVSFGMSQAINWMFQSGRFTHMNHQATVADYSIFPY